MTGETPIVFDPPFAVGADVYRRRILVRATAPDEIVSELEDDFHHFVVTLRHDGHVVVAVEAESIRWPWSTCPGARRSPTLARGAPLTTRWTHAARWTSPALNCTHQFDAAAHAITHAARLRGRRSAARFVSTTSKWPPVLARAKRPP